MATVRDKSWFFQTPRTGAYDRLSKGNKTSENTWRDFVASIPFFQDAASTATSLRLGITKQALDNDVSDRLSFADAVARHVEPYQVPMVKSYKASSPPDPSVGSPTDTGGVRVYIHEKSWTGLDNKAHTRDDLMVQLWPYNLDTATPDSAADYIAFTDASDSNNPKKALISTILGSGIFQRAATTISPVNPGDILDMGEGDIKGGDGYFENIILEAGADRTISLTSTTGNILNVHAGTNGAGVGGALKLYGGQGSTYGGDAHLYGGSGVTDYGNTLLCWDGSTKKGLSAIGGAVVAGMQLSIYGKLNVVSGGMRVKGYGASAITTFIGLDSSDDLQARTVAQVTTDLFGSASLGDILYYNGAAWSRLAAPVSEMWLKNNAGSVAWGTPTVASDGKVKVDAGATADYIGTGSGVIRLATNSGLAITDGGDYISVASDVNGLADLSAQPSSSSAMPITNASNVTKKIPILRLMGSKYAGWVLLTPITDYTVTPPDVDQITTSDLTAYVEEGMPIKYKLHSSAAYRYAVITKVNAGSIEIAGEPLGVSPDYLDELYVGSKDRVVQRTYHFNMTSYNSATSTGLLESKNNMNEGDRWTLGTAHAVRLEVIHGGADATVQPKINARVGVAGDTSEYICTSNTNKGVTAGLNWTSSLTDISTSYNELIYGDNIEIKVDQDGGTGDADYLTAVLTFILT